MASSSPLNIKSAARKLPIKRKNPQSQPIPAPNPNPNPNPNPPNHLPLSPPPPHAYDDDDPDAGYEEEDPDDEGGDSKQPPFKFHRIWPESDEIRFLQGLLGCWSQGLVFPRDLNIFYDRFSESMSQPYTRSQLSEKLRRLRKKYRTMSGRIGRGQDPSRLSQHDRDLLHLSTRLWDPSNAPSSPFSSPDAVPAGSAGNKRRRPNPRAPSGRSRSSSSPPQVVVALESAFSPQPRPPLALPSPAPSSSPTPIVPATNDNLGAKSGVKHLTIKSVLNVFEGVLNEVRATHSGQLIASSDGSSDLGSETKKMTDKFQVQRLAELDLLARRWRLILEQKSNQEQI